LGASVVAPEGFEEHGPFDVVLELVGAPNLAANVGSLATGGRVVVIGIGAGAKAELNLGALMGARGRVQGSTLRARPLEEKAIAQRLVERHVLPLVAAGRVRVPVAAAFPLDQAAAAHALSEGRHAPGRIVLTSTARRRPPAASVATSG
jgi:NADPH:quinone reductase-like Zn-dependent oxidoreductase